jgi:hypothetical protein
MESNNNLKIIIKLFVFILSIISFGIVAPIVWGWFIMPLGLIAITFWHVLGIRLILNLFTISYSDIKNVFTNKNFWTVLKYDITYIISIWVTFGLGYLYKLFM